MRTCTQRGLVASSFVFAKSKSSVYIDNAHCENARHWVVKTRAAGEHEIHRLSLTSHVHDRFCSSIKDFAVERKNLSLFDTNLVE